MSTPQKKQEKVKNLLQEVEADSDVDYVSETEYSENQHSEESSADDHELPRFFEEPEKKVAADDFINCASRMSTPQIKQDKVKKLMEEAKTDSGVDYVPETDKSENQHSEESSAEDELSRFFEKPEVKTTRKSTRKRTLVRYNSENSPLISTKSTSSGKSTKKRTKTVKPLVDLFESNSESSSSSSSDEDFTPVKKRAKPAQPRSKKIQMYPSPKRELSEFEKLRERNIQERMRLFKELGIGNITQELKDIPRRPVIKLKPKEPKPILPPRAKSERVKTINNSVTPEIALSNGVSRMLLKPFLDMSENLYLQHESCKFFKNCVLEKLLGNMNSKMKTATTTVLLDLETCNLEECESEFAKLSTNDVQALKIFQSQISSIDFNPMSSSLVMSAGTRTGCVAIWNYNSEVRNEKSSVIFEPHRSYVSCVSFSRYNSSILYSTSHDGTCRKGDFTKSHFELAYASGSLSKIALNWLAELSSSVIMIALQTGQVSRIDTRESTEKCKLYSLHSSSVVTVSVNNNTLLTTATEDEMISLFDIRKLLSYKPACSIKFNGFMPSSAFLSYSGTKLLTTTRSQQISIYEDLKTENPVMCWDIRRYQPSVPIYGKTLAVPYKAMWHPLREDYFCVGNLYSGVDLYKCKSNEEPLINQHIATNLRSSHCDLATFHPSLPAMVAGGGNILYFFN